MKRTLLLCALLLAACAPASSLQGSLMDEVSLDFDAIRIERSEHAVAVSYLHSLPGTTGQDVVLSLVANTDGVDLRHGGTLTLTDSMADDSLRGSVARSVHDDSRRTFAGLARGSIAFDAEPRVGAKVSGNMSLLFATTGGLGAGRTAFGDFAGTVAAGGATQ